MLRLRIRTCRGACKTSILASCSLNLRVSSALLAKESRFEVLTRFRGRAEVNCRFTCGLCPGMGGRLAPSLVMGHILDKRSQEGALQYFIRWQGKDPTWDSWEFDHQHNPYSPHWQALKRNFELEKEARREKEARVLRAREMAAQRLRERPGQHSRSSQPELPAPAAPTATPPPPPPPLPPPPPRRPAPIVRGLHVHGKPAAPAPGIAKGDVQRPVERLLGKRRYGGSIQYLARWKGADSSSDTWTDEHVYETESESWRAAKRNWEADQISRRSQVEVPLRTSPNNTRQEPPRSPSGVATFAHPRGTLIKTNSRNVVHNLSYRS